MTTRRTIAAAGAAAAIVLISACSGPAGAVEAGFDAPPTDLDRFYTQELTFGACATPPQFELPGGATQECATLEVPIDYEDPDGDTAQLAVSRIPARGEPIGSLVTNPGGPGFAGTVYLPLFATSMTDTAVMDRFDLVGFDPRGIGASTPAIDCFTDAERDAGLLTGDIALHGTDLRAVDLCADSVGGEEALAHFGIRDTARDVDVLRAALGDEQLTYAGTSYGTRLGPVYAEQFPERVRAMVLDGAIDPTLDTADRRLDQLGGIQQGFERVAAACAEQPSCPLGTDPAQATSAFHDLVRPLIDTPAPTAAGRDLTYDDAMDAMAISLYSPTAWPVLFTGLTELAAGGGDTLLVLRDILHERTPDGVYPNAYEATLVQNCLDEDRFSEREWAELNEEIYASSPVLDPGRELPEVVDPCEGWPTDPTLGFPYADDIDDLAPTLTVSATGDALTPHETGSRVAEILGGSLLTVEADQHGVLIRPAGDCVEDALATYLVDLQPPADGLVCPGA